MDRNNIFTCHFIRDTSLDYNMKVGLLYFSGTGATARIAGNLREKLQKSGHVVDLVRIKRNRQLDLQSYDLIGIGTPTYSFRAPRIVTNKLRHSKLNEISFFVFCTSGGMPGNTLRNLYDAVKNKAGRFLGSFEAVAITNLRSWMPQKNLAQNFSSGLGRNYQSQCDTFIQNLLIELENKKTEYNPPPRNIVTSFWSLFFTWRWQMAATVGFKQLSKHKCNQCGLCADQICPSGAIRMKSNGYPGFNEFKCVGCNGCVNLCPQDAIWSFQTRNHQQYTSYRKNIIGFEKSFRKG
ncbi:MAG: EFR1 family ferrodoxin [Promethearchaeota archaeon]